MLRVRIASVALLVLFVGASISQAAEKGEKKKARGGVAGTVKSVDATAKTITITVKVKKQSEDKTLTVADDAKVTINGEEKTLADIDAGARAQLKLSADGKTVTAINVGKKKKNA